MGTIHNIKLVTNKKLQTFTIHCLGYILKLNDNTRLQTKSSGGGNQHTIGQDNNKSKLTFHNSDPCIGHTFRRETTNVTNETCPRMESSIEKKTGTRSVADDVVRKQLNIAEEISAL